MEILVRLENFIVEQQLFTKQDRLLLAVSGGRDSMVMLTLLHRLGYDVVIAHCNFQLRGDDSDLDELVVKEYASQLKLPFFSQSFDTAAYARQQKISIQMAARRLRFEWFEKLCKRQRCNFICIAQHQQDHIETVFVNLIRGTGIQGLQGILPKREKVIRPILFMTPKEIADTAYSLQVPYRDDLSNFDNKYTRNKIRLDLLPVFRQINPFFDQMMAENIERFAESHSLLQSFVEPIRQQLFIRDNDRIKIKRKNLEPHLDNLPLLYELFCPYGFEKHVLKDMTNSWKNGSGLKFQSGEYELVTDREHLYLQRQSDVRDLQELLITGAGQFEANGLNISLCFSDTISVSNDPNIVTVDLEKLVFPLKMRFWKEGDRFQPLGMSGTKKVSDFFVSQKIPLVDKNRIPIIENGNAEIVWIVGYRLDNRYRITENTKKVATFAID